MIIACTNTFIKDITELSKKVKDGYQSCMDDIFEEFKDKTITEISNLGDRLNRDFISHGYEYRKIRIKNSIRKEGTRSGFRLYCVCAITTDTVILLHIYPKNGRLSGEDPGEKGKVKLIEEMISENGNFHIYNETQKRFIKTTLVDSVD